MRANLDAKSIVRTGAWSLILIQGFHLFEHVLQTIQTFAWHQEQPRGLLGALADFEWVHLLFNGGLWLGLVVLLVLYGRRAEFRTGTPSLLWTSFVVGTILQTYHITEHIVRIEHLLATGVADPHGILGTQIDVVVLHLFLNAAVYVAILPLLFFTVLRRAQCGYCESGSSRKIVVNTA